MQYANRYGYTDTTPHEVVRVVSNKTLEVRRMAFERDPDWKPHFEVGGFAGNCTNQESQRWIITPDNDPENPVFRIRLGRNGWKDKGGQLYRIESEPKRFYDYNF